MVSGVKEFSVVFIIYGGFAGIYDEYLYIHNSRAIIRKDFDFYEVEILDKRIYNYIEKVCKRKSFDFHEVPLPTDATTFKLIINKPCKKELEVYAIGFGNKADRMFINKVYELSRNINYKILNKTLPSKIIIYYSLLDFFEKPYYIDLSELELKENSGTVEVNDKDEILNILEKIKNYKGSRLYYIKSKGRYYIATFEIKIGY
ncbi:MAG: hypothetical protein N2504_00760 [candidate division WOR-3 bacterium]|nr:hypothetical protein [candidate division WOR-3 bacterium]MCX7947105.1 hypothetical protein [candidate division WOR-3 bacterium]MDW8149854.1 hypothetical protein [candidate division WOR-3 bacterium]